jgi:hypothetical protein
MTHALKIDIGLDLIPEPVREKMLIHYIDQSLNLRINLIHIWVLYLTSRLVHSFIFPSCISQIGLAKRWLYQHYLY